MDANSALQKRLSYRKMAHMNRTVNVMYPTLTRATEHWRYSLRCACVSYVQVHMDKSL